MSHGENLYKWERITKPRVYSRSQRVTSNDDIQDWIQKVEHASTKAAAETFGTKYIPPRRFGKEDIKHVVEDAHIHEAAYSEAQDLLNQWVADKIHLENDLDDYDNEDKWTCKTQAEIKQEWDHLLSDDLDLELEETKRSTNRITSRKDNDPYAILYKDENDLVNEVLDEIWDKDLIDDSFKQNLEMDSEKHYDPTTKMKLRQKQVKDNREKRIKDKERKLKVLQMKKDAQFTARQMVQKEEKSKALQRKREEEDIQKEMAHIKKEMEDERKKQREDVVRKKTEEDALAFKANEELQRQNAEEMKTFRKTQYQADERKRQLMMKIQSIETQRATKNLKLLQKSFSAWYNVVIERRLSVGKAKATSDWKLLLRTFNAWKAYSRAKGMDKQAWTHEENLKDLHRKNNMAVIYYRHRLLSKCMTAWELFVSQQQTERYFEENTKKTKDKMASFLEAAASGKLWSDRSELPESSRSQEPQHKAKQVEALFNQPAKEPGTFSMNSTARSEVTGRSNKKVATPTEPWQITRKHLKLTKQQITSMAAKHQSVTPYTKTQTLDNVDNCICDKLSSANNSVKSTKTSCPHCAKLQSDTQQPSGKVTSRDQQSKKAAWEKTPFAVNNFEHRHAAQQKILEMQQKQIKEQHKLIEELQYLQKQQLLQQQLLQQEQGKRQIDDGGGDTQSIQNTLTHLQKHIHKLQQQIIEGGSGAVTSSPVSKEGGNDVQENGNVMDIELRDIEDDDQTAIEVTANHQCLSSMGLNLDFTKIDENKQPKVKVIESQRTAKSAVSNVSNVSNAQSGTSSLTTARTASTAASNPRHQQFLKTMEDRATDRAAIKRERDEKKHKQEELKLAQLMAEEEQRKLDEAEMKQRRIEEHREKKRLEKQREKEKQEFAEKLKVLTVKADSHRQQSLLKYRGWRPWRRLIEILRGKEDMARLHYQKSLLRKCLVGWQKTVVTELEERYKIAEQFNTYRVINQAFLQWKQVKHASVIQEEKADRHYEYKLKLKVVRDWADFAAEEKVSMWHKERKAREHSLERIKKKYFNLLRYMPVYRREEEEREKRRREMRKKVAHLLPDFRASQNEDIV